MLLDEIAIEIIDYIMKRILSFIVLLFVLTVSVHPVITLHFCNDDLHSFTVLTSNDVKGCCVSSSSIPVTNNVEVFSFDPLESLDYVAESCESCCSYQKIEIATDNFTADQTNTSGQNTIPFSYISLSAIVDYLINLFTPDTLSKSYNPVSHIGLHSSTLKFLSYICVYRL